MHGQYGNLYFVSICRWYCGCDFTPFSTRNLTLLDSQFISASCGLHPEYLKDNYWENLVWIE